MWIESVRLEGFRSFQESSEVHFHSGHTAVIGRNGSGKSNLLAALAFVVQAPAGHSVFDRWNDSSGDGICHSAQIEVVINDDEGCLQHGCTDAPDSKKIVLKRILGQKKDSFFIDGRSADRKSVIDLLNTGGVLTSNPYHFVRQGEINVLVDSTPAARLKLLEDFAGTTVYKVKREAAHKALADGSREIEEIRVQVVSIERDRLDLEEESNTLQLYQAIKKKISSLQYVLYKRDESRLQNALQKLRSIRRNANLDKDMNETKDKIMTAKERLHIEKRLLKDLGNKVSFKKDKLDSCINEMTAIVESNSKLDGEAEDLRREILELEEKKKNAERDLPLLQEQVNKGYQALKIFESKLSKIRHEETEVNAELSRKHTRRDLIYSRKGQRANFKTKAQYLDWVHNERDIVGQQIERQKKLVADTKAKLAEQKDQRESLSAEIEKLRENVAEIRADRIKVFEAAENIERSLDQLKTDQRHFHREVREFELQVVSVADHLRDAEQKLARSPGMKQLFQGIKTLKDILRHPDVEDDVKDGVCGLVAENFACNVNLQTAICTTAGSRIFNVIVKTRHIAQHVLRWQKRLGLRGEIIFIPLDTIHLPHRELAYPNSSDCFPLLSRLEIINESVSKAMEFVFGRIVVVRTLDILSTISIDPRLTFVTLDGDEATGKGVMRGGFYKKDSSRLALFESYRRAECRLLELKKEVDDRKNHLSAVTEADLHGKLEQLEKLKSIGARHESKRQQFEAEIVRKTEEAEALLDLSQKSEATLISQNIQLGEMEEKFHCLSRILDGSETETSEELNELVDAIQILNKRAHKLGAEASKLESRVNELKNEINLSLVKNLSEQKMNCNGDSIQVARSRLETVMDKKRVQATELQNLEAEAQACDVQLKNHLSESDSVESCIDQLEQEISTDTEKLLFMQEHKLRLEEKERTVMSQLERATSKLIDTRTVPENYTHLAQKTSKECIREIEVLKDRLEQIGPVNEQASVQLETAMEKLKRFKQRLKKIEADHEAAKNLIELVTLKKNDKLHFTRTQVSKYFNEIFSELVPNGLAELRFETAEPQNGESLSVTSSDQTTLLEGEPVGLHFFVKSSSDAEMTDIKSLSGGQKTMVALAFIFSIQKCDPAPFYIFDEIDAALDPDARARVAAWIERSKNAYGIQYITSTFRRELMQKADKFVGVRCRNNVSLAQEISQSEAVDFIED